MKQPDRNIVEICGVLIKDLSVQSLKNKQIVGRITILLKACERSPQDSFYEIFIWNKRLIDTYCQYLRSGMRVQIRGQLSRSDKGIFINVYEDFGVMVFIDAKSLRSDDKGLSNWAYKLEKETNHLAEKLKEYEADNSITKPEESDNQSSER